MLVSVGLGVLHTGVERAWWTLDLSCTAGAEDLGAMDIATLLDPAQGTGIVLCTDVAWSLMGLSMASWNAVASLVLLALWAAGARALWGKRRHA
jgi:disulfide bond formation protein DsbB